MQWTRSTSPVAVIGHSFAEQTLDASLGLEIVAGTPEQFASRQRAEYALWGKVIEVGKITAE